jgi:hypothetical protein
MKIAVLGSNSLIGKFVSANLMKSGFIVQNFSRKDENFSINTLSKMGLKNEIVIDFAYDYKSSPKKIEEEIVEKSKFLKEFQGKYLYISSLSVFDNNNSMYSRQKKSIENIILNHDQYVVRIGLLDSQSISPRLWTRQFKMIHKYFKLLPFGLNSNSFFYVTTFSTLLTTLIKFINEKESINEQHMINIYDYEYRSLTDLLELHFNIKRKYQVRLQPKNLIFINQILAYLRLRASFFDKFSNLIIGMRNDL